MKVLEKVDQVLEKHKVPTLRKEKWIIWIDWFALNSIPKKICWCLKPWYLWMWSSLEIDLCICYQVKLRSLEWASSIGHVSLWKQKFGYRNREIKVIWRNKERRACEAGNRLDLILSQSRKTWAYQKLKWQGRILS